MALLGAIAAFSIAVHAADPVALAAQVKQQGDKYAWGEGRGDSEREATQNAVTNLTQSISLIVGASSDYTSTDRGGGMESRDNVDKTTMASAARLNNMESFNWEEETKDGKTIYHAFCYVSRRDLEEAKKMRQEKILSMIQDGMDQERQLNIGAALRYYNWALNMITNYGDQIKVKPDGKAEKDAGIWLPTKIESVLNQIDFQIDENNISYDPDEMDKYTISTTVTYAGKPVQSLDMAYHNGMRYMDTQAKNGTAHMRFMELDDAKKVKLKIEYAFQKEAEQSYDEEIKASFAAGPAFKKDKPSKRTLNLKVSQDKVELNKKEALAEVQEMKQSISPEAAAEAPLEGQLRKEIERPVVNDEAALAKMVAVEEALRTRKYETVRDLFTPEGYELFRRMTNAGKISVLKRDRPEYTIESTPLFTYGTGIPVALKTGKKITNERIVFRFDKSSGLIKSTAYALTRKAENDIFRQASWAPDSRYSLLTFMEDYQTAFCTQNIGFIEKLFSDDAIIIVGNKTDASSARQPMWVEGTKFMKGNKKAQAFRYERFNKRQYVDHLRQVFGQQAWTHVCFEENEIAKVNTGTLLNNEVLWIEIRQNWDSASGYNDTGFLALQINMKPKGSQINVRTFTPDFIPLDTLKKNFPVSIQL